MILRGILDNSLNGQLCIRGFAPIRELARISKADYTYQRNPIEGREDITDFLEKETYLFFPEIILSYKLKHTFDKGGNNIPPIKSLQDSKKYKSNIDKTEIKIKIVDYKNETDIVGKNKIDIVELIIDDIELNNLISQNKQPFHRIDGNHRLRAAEESENDKVKRMVAPYCIILGEEFYNNNILDATSSIEFDKSVKIFFHNINTKTIPLTSEENLKVIIDDKLNFPDDELEKLLGLYAVKTRQLIDKVSTNYFTGLEHILSAKYRTYYNSIFEILLEKDNIEKEKLVDYVFESLKAIDLLYSEYDELKANSSFGLLITFLYYHIEGNKAKFNYFKDWILHNHIFEVEEANETSLIKIFNKISERNIKIFVAMPYYEGSPQIMKSYNEAYERVMQRIRENYKHVNIELFPIMQYEGKTRDIIENMINEINECNIFIADITDANPNVGYELGIARALKKPTIIVRKAGDEMKVPFDYEHDVRNPYNEKAITTLEDEVYKNIIAILVKDYGYIINPQ